MNCNMSQLMFDEALHGDLDSQQEKAFQAHLGTCSNCSDAFTAYGDTLDLVERFGDPAPQVPDIWNDLQPQLDLIDRKKRHSRIRSWGLALSGVAAILLIVMGLEIFNPDPVIVHQKPENKMTEVERFLERSRPLVMRVANGSGSGSPDPVMFDLESRLAGELAVQAREISITLKEQDQARSHGAKLVADLELVFWQWGNLSPAESRHGLGLIKEQLETRDVLFRMTLIELKPNYLAKN